MVHAFTVQLCAVAVLLASGATASAQEALTDAQFFEQQVLPILEETCLRCHNEERQRGGLRLDSRGALLRGGDGGVVITPGDPEASRLVRAIRREGDLEMPPKKELDAQSVDILTEWIRRGAPWPEEFVPAPPADTEIALVEARSVPQVEFAVEPGEPVEFDRQIRPLLSDRCYACHGPDAAARKAGMRLDLRDAAMSELPSGHTPVVPGSLEKSQIFQRIAAADPEDRMPPAEFHKTLDRDEIELLGRWILQGAPWEEHWAFMPVRKPQPPEPDDAAWPRNPIDRFVAAQLDAEGLAPAPEADRRTLIRRLTYDLTGLPPTREEVHAFLSDTEPGAYERLVDRLLASPHYGEHRARYWLDAARYADTNGYHIDNMRYMWRWRDWVIDSFNENKPFDEFTVEQLAGDLLPNPTRDQRIATGFNRNHMVNFEGGAIPEEYRVQYVMDRVDTTATVWMGLTVHCAQCHDHKFDPITQREFYKLFAFFNTVDEQGLDGREGNAAPIIAAPMPEDEEEMRLLETRLADVRERLTPSPELEDAYEEWLDETAPRYAQRWTPLGVSHAESSGGADMTLLSDYSVRVSGTNPETDTYEVLARTGATAITALRLEALLDDTLPNAGPGRAENNNFVLTNVEVDARPLGEDGEWKRVNLARAYADHDHDDLTIDKAIDDDPASGWSAEGMRLAEPRTAEFVLQDPIRRSEGIEIHVRLHFQSEYPQRTMARFRLSVVADEERTPSRLDPWYASGPFAAESVEDAFTHVFAPEDEVDLDGRYTDGRLKWTQHAQAKKGLTNDPAALYLYRTIHSSTDRTMVARLTSRQRLRVMLNGDVIHEDAKTPGDGDEARTVHLPLRAGANDLLVKLVSGNGTFDAQLAALDEYGGELPSELQLALAEPVEKRRPAQTAALREHFFMRNHPQWERYRAQESRLEEKIQALRDAMPTTMVMAEMEAPRATFVLDRGQYDQPREEVDPGTPAFLPPMPPEYPQDRLGLARWLVDPRHPLTARVTVNRFWQQIFGQGIVRTSEDFGSQGARPTHPALLDWLATEFVDSGWDVKALFRLMVTSATYRQSAKPSPEALEADPQNRLLARGPRYRMDAEMIRDTALAVSGLLVPDLGGPSVSPYQPAGLWKAVAYGANFSAQEFEQDHGEDLYRRSLYTFWKRTSPPPNMIIFDAPNRETCTVRRARSNTPLQALALMNDPQFVEAARVFAERIVTEGGETVDDRIAFAFEVATARPPKPSEEGVLRTLYAAQRSEFEDEPEKARALLAVGERAHNDDLDPVELAAWTTIATTVLNLDETITKS